MSLYNIYNLPIYNHHIGKSLQYELEESNPAITKDNKYATILLTWNLPDYFGRWTHLSLEYWPLPC